MFSLCLRRAVYWSKSDESDCLFLTQNGTELSSSLVTKLMKSYTEKSGVLGDTGSRNIRRSIATRADEKNLDTSQMSKKMMHSKEVHQQFYQFNTKGRNESHTLNRQLRDVVNNR